MHTKITAMLQSTYLVWEQLRTRYTGPNTNITASITQNIQNYIVVALRVCYNYSRVTIERYSPNKLVVLEIHSQCTRSISILKLYLYTTLPYFEFSSIYIHCIVIYYFNH